MTHRKKKRNLKSESKQVLSTEKQVKQPEILGIIQNTDQQKIESDLKGEEYPNVQNNAEFPVVFNLDTLEAPQGDILKHVIRDIRLDGF